LNVERPTSNVEEERKNLFPSEGEKWLGSHATGPNKSAKCSFRDFLVIGNGERSHVIVLHQNHVTAALPNFLPTIGSKYLEDFSAT